MFHRKILTIGLVAVTALIGAAQDEETERGLRQIAEQLRERAVVYAEDGNSAAAEDLENKAAAVLLELERRQQQADEFTQRRKADELHQALRELERHEEILSRSEEPSARKRLEEIRDKILQTRVEMRQMIAGGSTGRSERKSVAKTDQERLEHMHAALDHLRQANEPDLAEQVSGRIEALQRQLDPGKPSIDTVEMLEQVMQEMQTLRDEVAQLRTAVENQSGDR